MSSVLRTRRSRWLVPVVLAGVIGLMALVPTLAAGAQSPSLAPITPQALLEKVQAAHVDGLSGTIELTTNLGLPDLSALSGAVSGDRGGFNPVDLLAGMHSAQVWASDRGFKATYSDGPLSEDDVVATRHDVWTWQSQGQQVTHLVLPAPSATGKQTAPSPTPPTGEPVETPDQVASAILGAVAPSTDVTVGDTATVAGRASYQLELRPRDANSTVDHVAIAVDSDSGLPLRLQIFAKGQSKVALEFGFSSLDLSVPSAGTFTFTPPPGAQVKTETVGGTHDASGPGGHNASAPQTVGEAWGSVAIFEVGQLPPQAGALSRMATPLPDGSGRLISTALVNVLLLDNGKVAVGAVSPAALEAAATSAH